jgi:hypothetical protein
MRDVVTLTKGDKVSVYSMMDMSFMCRGTVRGCDLRLGEGGYVRSALVLEECVHACGHKMEGLFIFPWESVIVGKEPED